MAKRSRSAPNPEKQEQPRDRDMKELTPLPRHASPPRPRLLLTFLLLAGIVGVVYGNSLGNRFVFDDAALIGMNPAVRDVSKMFSPGPRETTRWPLYRPLRTASYALDYALFGVNPSGYHLSNLIYHTLGGFFAYLIASRLLRLTLPALFVAILFLVHPIQTDSVTYLSGRRDILFGMFYLLGFFAFLRYRDTRLPRYLSLAILAYLLSLASKEMAVTLPFLCLTYDLMWTDAPPGPQPSVWAGLWERLKVVYRRDRSLYLAIGVIALAFIFLFVFRLKPTSRSTYYGDSFALTMLTVARVVVHYLKLLVFPRTLNADYSYNAFPITPTLTHLPSLAAALFLALLIVLLLKLAPAHRLFSFGGIWFFLTLLPVTHVIPHHELMAEHYLYIPSFGIFLAAGYAVEEALLRNWAAPRLLYPVLLVVVLLLSARTVIRNRDWKDDFTFWKKTAETAPMSARARGNLGRAFLRRNMDNAGLQELEEAVRIKPDLAPNRDALGLAYLRFGRLAEAERELKEALRLTPSLVGANMNLAYTYIKQGRKPEAVAPFLEALRLRPSDQEARAQLALLYMNLGRLKEAEQQLLKLSKYRPKDPKLYVALGTVYHRSAQPVLAKAMLEKAARLGGEIPEVRALRQQIEGGKRNGQRRLAR